MSEKRFYITDAGLGLDTESDEMYGFCDEEDFCRLFDKLNEQQATIKQLEEDKAIAEDYANIFEKENVKLRKKLNNYKATVLGFVWIMEQNGWIRGNVEDLIEDLRKSDDEFAKRMSAWLEEMIMEDIDDE